MSLPNVVADRTVRRSDPTDACIYATTADFHGPSKALSCALAKRCRRNQGVRIQAVEIETGTVETIYTECNGESLKVRTTSCSTPRAVFTSLILASATAAVLDRGSVYYARPDGRGIEEIVHPIDTPNGIGLSPMNRRCMSQKPSARGYGVRHRTPRQARSSGASVLPRPAVAQVRRLRAPRLAGDGLRRQRGRRYLGHWLCNGDSPDGGVRARVPVPEFDVMVTNVCFGGPDLHTAYITSSDCGECTRHAGVARVCR